MSKFQFYFFNSSAYFRKGILTNHKKKLMEKQNTYNLPICLNYALINFNYQFHFLIVVPILGRVYSLITEEETDGETKYI